MIFRGHWDVHNVLMEFAELVREDGGSQGYASSDRAHTKYTDTVYIPFTRAIPSTSLSPWPSSSSPSVVPAPPGVCSAVQTLGVTYDLSPGYIGNTYPYTFTSDVFVQT